MTPRHASWAIPLIAVLTVASCKDRRSPDEPSPAPVCSPSITPESRAFSEAGGSASVAVSVAAGCAWTASSAAAWASITAGATGTGAGTVDYTVAANAAVDARATELTIAGRRHALTQAGRPPVACTFALSPPAATFDKDGGEGAFTIDAPATCAWTAGTTASWLAVAEPAAGTGPGLVRYTVQRSLDVETRRGTITVGDRTFAVEQTGDVGICRYDVTPVELRPCMPETALAAALEAPAACPWTVASAAPWLTLRSPDSGRGPATLQFEVGANYDAPRHGVVEVRWPAPTAGQNIHVFQAGCRYAVSVPRFAMPAAGGAGTFDVIQQSDPTSCGGATQDRCLWRAEADAAWIAVGAPGDHAGDDRVTFTIAPNQDTAARTGQIRVRDQVVVVTQAGR